MLDVKKNTHGTKDVGIVSEKKEQLCIPLNKRQFGLWMIQKKNPDRADYNVSIAFELQAELSLGKVCEIVINLMSLQPALRSYFYEDNGQPMQKVLKRWNGALNIVPADLVDIPLSEYLRNLTDAPFSLEGESACRVNIIEQGDAFIIHVVSSHIVADATTAINFEKDFIALLEQHFYQSDFEYAEFSDETYFTAIQHQDRDDTKATDFWAKELDGVSLNVEVGTAVSNGSTDGVSVRTKAFDFAVSEQVSGAITELGKRNRNSPFCIVTSIFGIAIHRCFRTNDFALGYVRDTRTKKLASMYGYFVEQYPLPVRLKSQMTGIELITDIRSRIFSHRKRGDISGVRVMEDKKKDYPGDAQLLNLSVGIALLNPDISESDTQSKDYQLNSLNIGSGHIETDLSLIMDLSGDKFLFRIQYNSQKFTEFEIQSFEGVLRNLIDQMISHSEDPINSWDLVNEEEKASLLCAYDFKEIPRPDYRTLSEIFVERVKEQPDAVAVVDGNIKYTYKEINRLSNLVKHTLLGGQVKPGNDVAICMQRGVGLIVSVLGIHKAGCGYIPLEPSFPVERLEYIISDAGVQTILAEERFHAKLGGACIAEMEFLSIEQILAIDDESLAHDSPLHTDYPVSVILYTSGSTGRPKGVEVTHKGIINTLYDMQNTMPFTSDDQIVQLANYVFDSTAVEFHWWYLGKGSTAVVPSGKEKDLEYLVEFYNKHKSTCGLLVPAMLTTCLDILATLPMEKRWPSVKQLFIGGDRFPLSAVTRLKELGMDHVKLQNIYGPTEVSIFCTRFQATDWTPEGNSVPIGTLVPNLKGYVVDENLKLVPQGFAGELCLAGPGVALGYRNLPDKTAQAFIDNPYSDGVYATLYRTGDAVRLRQDGNLEYIDRIDTQVKIRGLRIELGEIEEWMMKHPDVLLACAVVKQAPTGAYIVAYFTSSKPDLEYASIKNFIGEYLAPYMIPSYFQQLESLPTTPSNKFDRKLLAAKPLEEPPLTVKKPEPDSEIKSRNVVVNQAKKLEDKIQSIWQDVLQKPNVDKRTNFFEQGGHSLLITKIVQSTKENLGYDISVPDFFRFPTVHDLSNFLMEKNGESPTANVTEVADTEPQPQQEQPNKLSGKPFSLSNVEKTVSDIAVIGMACRFPGANNATEFWNNLVEGVEGIQDISVQQFTDIGYSSEYFNKPGFVARQGFIENSKSFDASFFGYSPKEAELIDPQQRLFLEEAFHALEDGGYGDVSAPQHIGVYGSASFNFYARNLDYLLDSGKTNEFYQLMNGNGTDFLCTRVAYKLNLTGPALTVQTACSSSLVAIERACTDIKAGHCDMALAGGVCLIGGSDLTGYQYVEGMVLSPDGRCRTFDADALGTVPSQGVGVVLLKPLKQAVKDGDFVRAVVKGAAINNDGYDKVGFTAPSTNGQKAVIRAAQKQAGIDPASISYIEAHGTATPMGDPIEIAALTLAFSESKQKLQRKCAIGSVKSNLGHCDAAAGIAGFIKTVLCLQHNMLVPSLHYSKPNPAIDFEHSPFYVSTETSAWTKQGKTPRRAGVSAFGIGGTNAHVVLEEAPPEKRKPSVKEAPWYCIPVTAASEEALKANIDALSKFLQTKDNRPSPEDLVYTLQVGRHARKHRSFAVLKASDYGETLPEFTRKLPHFPDPESPLCFHFGSDITNQALNAYREFTQEIHAYQEQLNNVIQALPDSSKNVVKEWQDQIDESVDLPELQATMIAFVHELALANMLSLFGWHPEAVTGDRLSLVTAACFIGVLPIDEGIALLFGDEEEVIQTISELDTSLGSAAIFVSDDKALRKYLRFAFVQAQARENNRLATAIRLDSFDCAAIAAYQLLGSIWCAGNSVDWHVLYPNNKPKRVAAPKYVFDKSVYYVDKVITESAGNDKERDAAVLSVQNEIAKIWEQHCEVTEIEPDQNLTDLGAGSLMALNIIDNMNQEFGISLDSAILHEAPTLAELAERVYTSMNGAEGESEEQEQELTLDVIRAKVAKVWEDHLSIKNLVGRDDFFDLGGDSLIAMGLFDDINNLFDTRFSASALYEASTLDKFSALVEKEIKLKKASQAIPDSHAVPVDTVSPAQEYTPLVLLQGGTNGDLPPVFLVHAAGGGVIQFSNIVRELGREYTIMGLDSPVDMAASELDSIESLARVYTEAILAQFPHQQNFILGGHSFGPVVALDIGRQLTELGRKVDHMIAIDPPGPGKMPVQATNYTQILLHLNDDRLPLDEEFMLSVSLEEQIDYMKAKAGDFIWRRVFNIITPTFMRDFKTQMDILFEYRYPTLDCSGIYFTPKITMPLMQKEMYVAWQSLLQGKLEIIEVEGNHMTMMEKPGALTIADSVRQLLDSYK